MKTQATNRRDAIYQVLASTCLIACTATGELGGADGAGRGASPDVPSASVGPAPTSGAPAGGVEGVPSAGSDRDRTDGIDRSRGIDGPSSGDIVGVASDDGPFKSLETAANSPAVFSAPRAGVPLQGNAIAFVALAKGTTVANAAQPAIFAQRNTRTEPTVLYSGAGLVSPLDIDVSIDGRTLFVADFAGGSSGTGAILSLPATGGSPSFAAEGWSPRSVTVGPNDEVYFSGLDPSTGKTGVFQLTGGTVSTVFSGGPLIEPSGIAAFADGRLLVADARALDNVGGGDPGSGGRVASEASIVLIDKGQASVFATGFAAGFPAGLALTLDESTLVVSGEGRDRSDTVWLIDVANPTQKPKSVTDSFSRYQDAAAGIKRAHRSNTFLFASTAADGGTVFKIEG